MVGELGNFWCLGHLGQVWVKYGRSGEMHWGVGGGKGRCVGGVGSVLGCGKVWGGVGDRGRCREVCLGCGEMCLVCGERCEKSVGVGAMWGMRGSVGRNVGQSGCHKPNSSKL